MSILVRLAAALHVLERDIAILGGGSSGTYAAVNLLEKYNQSVLVIEKLGRLGGATHTYTDPTTGFHFDYGVQYFHNDSNALAYLDRIGVSYTPVAFDTQANADFSNSVLMSNFSWTISTDYLDELDKYSYLTWGYEFPDGRVPEELLVTWPEFVEKHNITTSALGTFQVPNAAGDPLKKLAVNQFNFLGLVMVEQMSGKAVQCNNNNSAIYDIAYNNIIGPDNVLLNSTVVSADRRPSGVELLVSTPSGPTLVRAGQLVVAAPPQSSNLAPLGLDRREHAVLREVGGYPHYVGVVGNTGLPEGYTYNNHGADAPWNVASMPYVIMIESAGGGGGGTGLFMYAFNALEEATRAEVEARVAEAVRSLQFALRHEGSDVGAEPTFVAFQDVGLIHPEQSAEAVRNGFYQDMYDLQGYRGTWYISALFVLSSAGLWNATEIMLPDIVAAAERGRPDHDDGGSPGIVDPGQAGVSCTCWFPDKSEAE